MKVTRPATSSTNLTPSKKVPLNLKLLQQSLNGSAHSNPSPKYQILLQQQQQQQSTSKEDCNNTSFESNYSIEAGPYFTLKRKQVTSTTIPSCSTLNPQVIEQNKRYNQLPFQQERNNNPSFSTLPTSKKVWTSCRHIETEPIQIQDSEYVPTTLVSQSIKLKNMSAAPFQNDVIANVISFSAIQQNQRFTNQPPNNTTITINRKLINPSYRLDRRYLNPSDASMPSSSIQSYFNSKDTQNNATPSPLKKHAHRCTSLRLRQSASSTQLPITSTIEIPLIEEETNEYIMKVYEKNWKGAESGSLKALSEQKQVAKNQQSSITHIENQIIKKEGSEYNDQRQKILCYESKLKGFFYKKKEQLKTGNNQSQQSFQNKVKNILQGDQLNYEGGEDNFQQHTCSLNDLFLTSNGKVTPPKLENLKSHDNYFDRELIEHPKQKQQYSEPNKHPISDQNLSGTESQKQFLVRKLKQQKQYGLISKNKLSFSNLSSKDQYYPQQINHSSQIY